MQATSHGSLEELMQAVGNPVDLARNSQIGPYVYPAVAAEFTNWRDEQVAWLETCALFDQSHHMVNFFMSGPDALKLLSDTGINSFTNFPVNTAKQFVPTASNGGVIGDGILFYNSEGREGLVLIGHHLLIDWVRFNAEKAEAAGRDVAGD